ncbi:MAG: alpha/beta fold hydrolase [Desulfosalsimonadaceae bacterium]
MEKIIRTQELPVPDLHQGSAPDFLPDPSMPPGFPFRFRFINIKNFRLHYVHEGSGPPLILLHGGGTWLHCFHKNIPVLSKHFSVYAIDVPGHGFTRALNGDVTYDFDTVCDAIRQFMDVMKIEKAHIAGHSWGGGWAIRFAGRYPERMLKLVLIDASGINRHERLAWELLKYPVIGEIMTHFLTRHSVKRGLTLSFYNQSLVTDELVDLMVAPLRNKDNRKAQLRYSRNIDWETTKAVLPDIQTPALIIWGKQDRYIPVKFGKQMARLMPDARLEILERCGHSAHNECPETVNRMITEFLKS